MLKPIFDSDKESGKAACCDLDGTNNMSSIEAAYFSSPFPSHSWDEIHLYTWAEMAVIVSWDKYKYP